MTSTAQVPTWVGVLTSFVLVLVAAAVSWRDRLGLTRDLLWAAARAFVQLLAVGALLGFVFAYGGLLAAAAWLVAMVIIGGRVAGHRAAGLPQAIRTATLGIAAGAAATMGVLLALRIIEAEATVVIPVGGMVISATMVATGITLKRIRDDAIRGRTQIEAYLALGLPGAEAFGAYRRDCVRTALIPAIDQTKVVGLISLPGAMTGLILAGTAPLEAIRYQIVVMYMLLAAPALATMVAGRRAQRCLFDDAERLRALPSGQPAS